MERKRVKFWRGGVAAVVLAVLTAQSIATPAFAATTPAPAPAGQGLEISPPLIQQNVDPGQTVTLNIRLRNVTTGDLMTTGSVDDFVAQGEEGQPKLLVGEHADEVSPYTFKPWVGEIPSLTLVPQEAKTASITVSVPKDASPGGHYGVIRFTASPVGSDSTSVSLSASIGTLVLLNVSGKVVTKASIAELYALHDGQKGTFFEYGPLTFGIRIKNEGNVHFSPTGTMRVTNTFGREVDVLSINPKGGNILPQSIRKFEHPLEKQHLFGRYKVEANVQYSGKALSQTLTVWVIPYKLIAIGLGILIFLILILRGGVKRYNQFIIRKAHKASPSEKTTKKKK
jgi:hypothetical protein